MRFGSCKRCSGTQKEKVYRDPSSKVEKVQWVRKSNTVGPGEAVFVGVENDDLEINADK